MFSHKRRIILLIITLVILIITSFTLKHQFTGNQSPKFSEEIKAQAYLYKKSLDTNIIEGELIKLNDTKLSQTERYRALQSIFSQFDNLYFSEGVPEIRDFAKDLDQFASTNFKDDYVQGDFSIACADYRCGEKTPPEIKKIIKDVEKMSIDDDWKQSILFNLKIGSHVPYDTNMSKQDKMISYGLSINSLEALNSPIASATAQELKDFIMKEYDVSL